jgi:GNAT superfamily N-acetyltransferase
VGRFGDPEPLTDAHAVGDFDAGVASLTTWLIDHALQAGRSGSARTFVVTDAEQTGRVVGYHAIAAASVQRTAATRRAASGMPSHPVPAILLARVAVDPTVQGLGVGAWLLEDATRRALSASEDLGLRVLLVHAIDERARAFYERFGSEASPADPLNPHLLIKDIRKTLGMGGS